MGSEVEIYHEKQSRELCGLHALNNLFQSESAFSATDLNNICYSLSPGTWIWGEKTPASSWFTTFTNTSEHRQRDKPW